MVKLSAYFDQLVGIIPDISRMKVTAFEEGFSNQVYRLEWDGKPQLVLRVPSLDAVAFAVDREAEMQVIHLAVEAKLSPDILWENNHGVFVSRFVSARSFAWDVVHEDRAIERIAASLAKTHQLPKIEKQFSIYQIITHYLAQIAVFLNERPELKEEHAYLSQVFAALDKVIPNTDSVLCHNDLNPKNILMDDRALWLIDWEYAGVGDPLFDLAVVARAHNLDDRQRRLLIQHYQPSLAINDTMARLEAYGRAYSLREMAWLLLKHLTTPNDPDALGYYYEFKATPQLNAFL